MNKGKLYIVGIGPGGADHITFAAKKAIESSTTIVGYKTYLELIHDLLSGKEVISSGMTKEIDRAWQAISRARDGEIVSLVSGGDPGIYAMAGLVFEILCNKNLDLEMEVIPGIAAINGCAARLGAPLMHDFASISLSDLLTPWKVIEKRLHHAAAADFVIVLYNPKSKKRTEHIQKAQDIIMKYRAPETPAGIVTAATRKEETVVVTTLKKIAEAHIGMQSTVIIGNSKSFIWNGYMITPRGYGNKYEL